MIQITVMELYILYNKVAELLADKKISVYRSYVGNFFTSLEMMGVTLTVMKVDAELKTLIDLDAMARTVARRPSIILFDEPITNVDVEAKVQLKRALKELTRQHQQTIIYVTHDQTEAMTLADQIALMKEGEIVQCDEPRKLYNYPNDVFGGWFLGNPGMNFFEHNVEALEGFWRLVSPLFPSPLRISGVNGGSPETPRVTIGIRPEQVQIGLEQMPISVPGQVVRKFIVVGGQYLLTLKIGERFLKAKVDPVLGHQIQDEVWVKCPFEWITVFGPDGRRLEAMLSI